MRLALFLMSVTLTVSLTACADDDVPPGPMMDGDLPVPDGDPPVPDGDPLVRDADPVVPDADPPVPDAAPPGAATWAGVSEQIFVPICAGCHHSRAMGRFPLLEARGGYEAIVGVASHKVRTMSLVSAGDPAMSFLFHKISSSHGEVCRGAGVSDRDCGGRMPTGRPLPPRLTADQIMQIGEWITAGAPR